LLLKVKGRSDYHLRLEIILRIMGLPIMCVTLYYGLTSFCIGAVVIIILQLIPGAYYTKKLTGYGLMGEIKDIAPILCVSLALFLLVRLITDRIENSLIGLTAGIISGILFYIFVNVLLKSKELNMIISLIKGGRHG
jgi:FtsH-binding integral membrane protein